MSNFEKNRSILNWIHVEKKVEATKKGKRKSKYAKATDTGIDPELAAKRLNVDWDTAAEIEEEDGTDESDVPSAVVLFYLFTNHKQEWIHVVIFVSLTPT